MAIQETEFAKAVKGMASQPYAPFQHGRVKYSYGREPHVADVLSWWQEEISSTASGEQKRAKIFHVKCRCVANVPEAGSLVDLILYQSDWSVTARARVKTVSDRLLSEKEGSYFTFIAERLSSETNVTGGYDNPLETEPGMAAAVNHACQFCNGSGRYFDDGCWQECGHCWGTGNKRKRCATCSGTGRSRYANRCRDCDGTGLAAHPGELRTQPLDIDQFIVEMGGLYSATANGQTLLFNKMDQARSWLINQIDQGGRLTPPKAAAIVPVDPGALLIQNKRMILSDD